MAADFLVFLKVNYFNISLYFFFCNYLSLVLVYFFYIPSLFTLHDF